DQTVNVDLMYEFKGEYRRPFNANSPINHDIEHSVEDFYDLMLVYWIQDYNTKEVLQSGKVDNSTLSITAYETDDNNVKVFPNPSDGNFNVVSDIAFTQLKLRNMLGQEVFSTNASGKEYNIQNHNLSPGLYILQLKTDKGYINKKINIK
ncbi:MAG TPA: T9SS type A sorting domain-containing protein, partial [Bacteroidales bacterium]|nr:T9SS type A sorting domain-containing protein [Bacteroidales bacterium]